MFNPVLSNAPANCAIWNFEWSINTDYDSNAPTGNKLDDFTYALTVDFDPSAAVGGAIFVPANQLFADHAIGDNSAANGQGQEATDPTNYASLIAAINVAQNSRNIGFGFLSPFDPQQSGIYTITLEAFDGLTSVASTSINVEVSPVPLPAAMPLLGTSLGLLAFAGWRRRQRNKSHSPIA